MSIDSPKFSQAQDLTAWKAWQKRQQPVPRQLKAAVERHHGPTTHLIHDGGPVHTLVALESLGPTQCAALLKPLEHIRRTAGVAYLVPPHVSEALYQSTVLGQPGTRLPTRARVTDIYPRECALPSVLGSLRTVLAVGNYLPAGARAYQWAQAIGARFVVVQHGLLAYQAPPLPHDAHLLAFTSEDASWWSAGRTDVSSSVVGSQLLWEAAQKPATNAQQRTPDDQLPGVFLGQMHGAELPRRDFLSCATRYCQETGALYRPHPAEKDKLSRALHSVLRRRGVQVLNDDNGLKNTTGSVAAVFSTGVLEAAAAGRNAWVFHPNPPQWLQEFWQRYRMSRWLPGGGAKPTPPPTQPCLEPAQAIARCVFPRHEWSAQLAASGAPTDHNPVSSHRSRRCL